MNKITRLVKISLVISVVLINHAAAQTADRDAELNTGKNTENNTGNNTGANDHRVYVEMPAQSRQLMRQDMIDHLSALNEIIGYLASNDFNAAAEVAEGRMGQSTMGKHRESGVGPGRFMPLAMRKMGWSMHEAASEFAVIAKQGDMVKAQQALQNLTATCVACHLSYRTR